MESSFNQPQNKKITITLVALILSAIFLSFYGGMVLGILKIICVSSLCVNGLCTTDCVGDRSFIPSYAIAFGGFMIWYMIFKNKYFKVDKFISGPWKVVASVIISFILTAILFILGTLIYKWFFRFTFISPYLRPIWIDQLSGYWIYKWRDQLYKFLSYIVLGV